MVNLIADQMNPNLLYGKKAVETAKIHKILTIVIMIFKAVFSYPMSK